MCLSGMLMYVSIFSLNQYFNIIIKKYQYYCLIILIPLNFNIIFKIVNIGFILFLHLKYFYLQVCICLCVHHMHIYLPTTYLLIYLCICNKVNLWNQFVCLHLNHFLCMLIQENKNKKILSDKEQLRKMWYIYPE